MVQSERAAVPGLSYDPATRTIRLQGGERELTCAVGRKVLWATAFRATSDCPIQVEGSRQRVNGAKAPAEKTDAVIEIGARHSLLTEGRLPPAASPLATPLAGNQAPRPAFRRISDRPLGDSPSTNRCIANRLLYFHRSRATLLNQGQRPGFSAYSWHQSSRVETMMRSALYYPHTEVRSPGLLKTSLLLWDTLEYIVPYPDYEPQYDDAHIKLGIDLIGKRHYPTDEEKEEAHTQIKALVKRGLPSSFYLPHMPGSADYEIWPQKLLPKTWDLLKDARLAGTPLDNFDYPLSVHTGLTIMSIIADCCAGSTRRRVTDRAGAYATVAGLLNSKPSRGVRPLTWLDPQSFPQDLVHTSLQIIDAKTISLQKLIDFRKRECAEHGHAIRDLRHRYVERLETSLSALAKVQDKKSDVDELKDQFETDMKDDLASLREALRFSRNEVLTSREIMTAAVAATAVLAGLATGVIPAVFSGVVTFASFPLAIGGLFGVRNRYLSSRRSILEKHPMAYLLELEASQ